LLLGHIGTDDLLGFPAAHFVRLFRYRCQPGAGRADIADALPAYRLYQLGIVLV
jgi:hypothetical protein